MISISKQTDYACRILLHLAMQPAGTRVTAGEISRRKLIPRLLIRRIITQLAVAQLVTTTRGSGGGLQLARVPSEISLLDVVQAMEGPLALNPCAIRFDECPLMRTCSVHEAMVRAREALVAEFSRDTFDRLAQRARVLARNQAELLPRRPAVKTAGASLAPADVEA